jgi:hypothetical protein
VLDYVSFLFVVLKLFYFIVFSASNFKKCNRRQLDLKECVFEAARHGITQLTRPYRRLNIPSFDPLEIRELSTHSERVLVNMSEQLTNCKFFGLNNVKLEKFEFVSKNRCCHVTVNIVLDST